MGDKNSVCAPECSFTVCEAPIQADINFPVVVEGLVPEDTILPLAESDNIPKDELPQTLTVVAEPTKLPDIQCNSFSTNEMPQAAIDISILNGYWSEHSGKGIGQIAAGVMIWEDRYIDPTSELRFTEGMRIAINLRGQDFSGELEGDHCIHWSDGDVWLRSSVEVKT